jgi:uncharacterized membrane protein YhiD involved in acid resistance
MIFLIGLLLSILFVLIKFWISKLKRNVVAAVRREPIKEQNIELEKFHEIEHSINEFAQFDGVFEIHITVHPIDDFVTLMDYVKQHERTKGMKIVYAVTSIKNNQYMLSYFTRKNSDKLAIDLPIR